MKKFESKIHLEEALNVICDVARCQGGKRNDCNVAKCQGGKSKDCDVAKCQGEKEKIAPTLPNVTLSGLVIGLFTEEPTSISRL